MEKLRQVDLFATDPRFTLMGKQVISNWKTKIMTLLVIIISFAVSFTALKQIWIPFSTLPITSAIVDNNINIDPFLMLINYTDKQSRGTVYFTYDNHKIQSKQCPPQVQSDYSQCFLTPTLNLTQSNITIHYDRNKLFSLFVQGFSLSHIINNESKSFFQVDLISFMPLTITVRIVQLYLQNSIFSKTPKTFTGVMLSQYVTSLVSSNQTSIQSKISLQTNSDCLQYRISRKTFLQIISIFISYLRTLSSVIGIIIVINIFTFKNHITQKLYQSRHFSNKWIKIKLWFYDVLNFVGLGNFMRKRFNLFKKQTVISRSYLQVDKKISLENVMRVKKHLLRNSNRKYFIDQNNLVNDFSLQNQCRSSQSLKEDFDYDFKQEVKYTSRKLIQETFPQNKKSFIQIILQKLNSNPIQVRLFSKQSEKTSFFSIIITCLTISLVVPLLVYLGAFTKNGIVQSQIRLLEQSSFKFEENNNIHMNLWSLNPITEKVQKYSGEKSVSISILDENYETISEIQPKTDCAFSQIDDKGEQIKLTSHYCLPTPLSLNINKKTHNRTRIGININTQSEVFLILQTIYFNSEIRYGKLRKNISKQNTQMFQGFYYQVQISKIKHYSNKNLQELSSFSQQKQSQFVNTKKSLGGLIFSLTNQIHSLQQTHNSFLHYLRNVWGLNNLFFTLILTLIIFPYNNKVAKSNAISRIRSRKSKISNESIRSLQKQEEEESRIFGIQNMMQLLYSELNLVETNLPFIKNKLET